MHTRGRRLLAIDAYMMTGFSFGEVVYQPKILRYNSEIWNRWPSRPAHPALFNPKNSTVTTNTSTIASSSTTTMSDNDNDLVPAPGMVSFKFSDLASLPLNWHSQWVNVGPLFQCQWITGTTGDRCNDSFYLNQLPAHIREKHGTQGVDSVPVHCAWDHCNKGLKKGCLVRHVKEMHLRIIYYCDKCTKSFTRIANVNVHKKSCSGEQQ
ncbi:hypothetical protein EDB19DRAFT_1029779 [Suillus lakei]|nr:hypothetical protein EDB19DRAFT_1029779 [Suillus lakei]